MRQALFFGVQHVAAVCVFQTLHKSSVLADPLPPQLDTTLSLAQKEQIPSFHTPNPVFVNIIHWHTLNTRPSIPFVNPKPQTPNSHQHTTQLSLQTAGYCWCAAGHRSSSWVGSRIRCVRPDSLLVYRPRKSRASPQQSPSDLLSMGEMTQNLAWMVTAPTPSGIPVGV